MARQEEIVLFIILLAAGHENWHLQLYEEVRHNFCHLLQSLVQGRSESELDLALRFCMERQWVHPVANLQPEAGNEVAFCAGRSQRFLAGGVEGSASCKIRLGCSTASAVWF